MPSQIVYRLSPLVSSMFDAVKNIKILIDEDLSPAVARNLCEELLIDAVAVRDRGLLGADDRSILEYAFNDERILVMSAISRGSHAPAKFTLALFLFTKATCCEANRLRSSKKLSLQYILNLKLGAIW